MVVAPAIQKQVLPLLLLWPINIHSISVLIRRSAPSASAGGTIRKAMTCCCHGRILATPLLDPSQEVLGHTYDGPSFRIDPHTLKSVAGSLRYRPSCAHCCLEDEDFSHSNAAPSFRKSDQHSSVLDESVEKYSAVRLDVFLFEGNDIGVKIEPGSSIHLELNRKADEPILRSLQRLVLNIQKKLCPQRQQRNRKNRLPQTDPLVWAYGDHLDPNSKKLMNISDLNNAEFCRQILTWKGPIEIELNLDGLCQNGSVKQLMLRFEACSPTIASVKTFEDFNTRLFVGIPLMLSIATLYATTSRVEWYVDSLLHETTYDKDGLHSYVPKNADVGKPIAVLITPMRMDCDETQAIHDGAGAEHAFQFQGCIETRPDNVILNLRDGWLNEERTSSFRFLTYNILADQNAFSMTDGAPFYPYVTKETLEKRRRLPLILHEIITYNADVICLQEVDEVVFQTLLHPAFKKLGYQGYYTSKVQDGTREGCALFWGLEKFLPVDDSDQLAFPIRDLLSAVEESGEIDSHDCDETVRTLLRELPDLRHVLSVRLGHVFQAVRLRRRDDTQQAALWIVNTHLFYHPMASHIRLLQAYLLSKQVEKTLRVSPGDLIITGDFNSSLRNVVGKLLIDRCVPKSFRDTSVDLNNFDWETTRSPMSSGGKFEDHPKEFPGIALGADFPTLRSALIPEPEFTHFIDGFCAALDHVFISEAIECSSYAPMPQTCDMTTEVAMPSRNIPSDHVCVVCDMLQRLSGKDV